METIWSLTTAATDSDMPRGGAGAATALELEATPCRGAGISLVGQVVPGRPGTAEVQHPGGSVAVDVDEVGRFAAQGIRPGPMRVKLRLLTPDPGGRSELEIVTASLTL